MYTLQSLPSGLPVLTAPIAGTESVTVHVFVGAGSRYEERPERGISHFLEHMFFKGGKKYRNAAEVSQAIDQYGGTFNAFTGKEYAGYYVKIARAHAALACDVLSDMLLSATFPEEEVKKEQGVIIEELRMYKDTPMYQAGWDFEELLYGDQPLGWDTIGTEETIRAVNSKALHAHQKLLYTPDNMAICFAGNISEKEALAFGEQFFGGLSGRKARAFSKLVARPKERLLLTKKVTEQTHLVLGVEGTSAIADDHFAQSILSIALGGNMSSRMFQRIRERLGLCYYIHSSTDDYLDTGALSVHAGVDQSRMEEAITAIRKELLEAGEKGVTEEELSRGKEYMKGRLTLALEDSEERAHFFGRQQLLYAETPRGVLDIPAFFQAIEKVTLNEVNAFAGKTLTEKNLRLVVIGNRTEKEKLEKLL